MKPRKVTVCGTDFFGYIESVGAAFRRQGLQADVIAYPNWRFGWRSVPSRLGLGNYEKHLRRRIITRVIRSASHSDFVLLFRGDLFAPQDLERIRVETGRPVVFWLIDALDRMREGLELCRQAAFVFCYSMGDVSRLRRCGVAASFLPLAFDREAYVRDQSAKKDIDIYFVGNLNAGRGDYLEGLLAQFVDTTHVVKVDARWYSWRDPLAAIEARRRYPKISGYCQNRYVTHAQINRSTNRAKVNLNLVPFQPEVSMNIRTYEICGAGGFQLVYRADVLREVFVEGREVEAYGDAAELASKLRFYLDERNSPAREAIARNGYERARASHTFDTRAEEILSMVASRDR